MEEADLHLTAINEINEGNLDAVDDVARKWQSPCQVNTTHISCLYPEILAIIFRLLEVRDKGRAAQVCSQWREAAYHRSVWRSCEPKLHLRRANPSLFPSLIRRGIRRVQILSLRRSLRDVIQGLPNIESLDLSGCYNVTDIGTTTCPSPIHSLCSAFFRNRQLSFSHYQSAR